MSVEILDLAALALTAVFFALLYYLHKKKHVDFGVRTILAVGLGLIVGLVFKGHHTYVAAVGTIYAHVVSAVVIPLLVFSIISSIQSGQFRLPEEHRPQDCFLPRPEHLLRQPHHPDRWRRDQRRPRCEV